MSRRRDWGAGDFGTSTTVAGEAKGHEGEGVNGWYVCENGVPLGLDNHVNEALFALSNGYIGVRGTFEEGYDGPPDAKGNHPTEQGIFVNGFYDEHIIKYPEVGYGQAEQDSVMLNIINSKIITIDVDDERFSMYAHHSTVERYQRQLSLREGTLTRELEWTSPTGKKVLIETLRMVPLNENRKNIYIQEMKVTPLTDDIKTITIRSELDGKVTNKPQSKDPRVGTGFTGQVLTVEKRVCDDKHQYIHSKTTTSKLDILCHMRNKVTVNGEVQKSTRSLVPEQGIREEFVIQAKVGTSILIEKDVCYVTTQGKPSWEGKISADCLLPKSIQFLDDAEKTGHDKLKEEQKDFLKEFYEVSDIVIHGDELLQQGLRFNLFHLVQAVGRDGQTNIGAKGITGEGYNGHYFWDTEIYILPFFLYTKPDIARKLVEFRIGNLDKARDRAKELGGIKKGALYPWRTIHGAECSSYFPAGTAQLHINADIAWAFKQYMHATDDTELLLNGGAEMILEMARFWLEYGSFGIDGHFHINCVTGPDEYTCLVNDNYYTNVMVQDALLYASDAGYLMKHEWPEQYQALCKKINLTEDELDAMLKASQMMYLPYDKHLGVHPQDDSFLSKNEWDFENTPPEKYPLLLHFHYLIIYKFKVIKQADLVLALLLQGSRFTDKEKKLNYDYYEPLTTHDSSLSTAVYAVMAAEIGYYQKAYNYFKCTARMDLDNIHHNSQHGIHTACMAGTWMCVVRGFAGFRVINEVAHFNPYLPQEWKGYTFRVAFHKAVLELKVGTKTVTYTCVKGSRINFVHADTHKVHLKAGKSQELLMKGKFEDLTSLNFDSVVIDLDAAIPGIQLAHYESWKIVIAKLVDGHVLSLQDYTTYLMNQISLTNRFEGLAHYLRRLDIELSTGNSHDGPGLDTLSALGNLKTNIFRELILKTPPKASKWMLRLVKDFRSQGIKVGVVSFSKSGESLIDQSGLKRYVDAYVTGKQMGVLGLRGKPHMDMYQRVVEQLFTDHSRTVIIIGDPVGFDHDQVIKFKYSISVPSVSLYGKVDASGIREIERSHTLAGINKVILPDCTDELDSDLIDSWVEHSEPYEERIERVKIEGLKRTESSLRLRCSSISKNESPTFAPHDGHEYEG
eukprot:TRINITY_DN3998_c1_g1_i1.p1 TRINITY_DN3998_c1_g1~~TRINITY_DN3998_c1_g1_i1.p1  ORF type:complete len:1132 (+),score=222.03 TRINITY_DN3998_c1_g1_i1:82-3477(+)